MTHKPESPLSILFLATEAYPFTGSGVLADMVGLLPPELARLGVEVRTMIPRYRHLRQRGPDTQVLLERLAVPLGGQELRCNILESRNDHGQVVYFVERPDLYDRPEIKGDELGDYYDNLDRFTFLCNSALRTIESNGYRPHLVHCHDWPTGLLPALLRGPFRRGGRLQGLRTLFTLHDSTSQGLFPRSKLAVTGLSEWEFFHPDGVEHWGRMSCLKSGTVYSNALSTLSPSYADEIQNSDQGVGMQGLFHQRRHAMRGIVNGLDYQRWSPARDSHIASSYHLGYPAGKAHCKAALCQELGMDPALAQRPLLAMAHPLVKHKGFELLLSILDQVMAQDLGVVVLTRGGPYFSAPLEAAVHRHPGRFHFVMERSVAQLHRLIAGADILLLPARYEPSGTMAMLAQSYGTIPVARATGGLRDCVQRADATSGTGFKFQRYSGAALLAAIQQAVAFYSDQPAWGQLCLRAMAARFPWADTARAYLDYYREILAEQE